MHFYEKNSRPFVWPMPVMLAVQGLTAAGPASTMEAMLEWIGEVSDKSIANAVREILAPDSLSSSSTNASSMLQNDPSLPETLRTLIQLMRANIEEPLSARNSRVVWICHDDRSSDCSRPIWAPRLRVIILNFAWRGSTFANANLGFHYRISLACGFVSSSHFSTCFKDFFGESPSVARKKKRDASMDAQTRSNTDKTDA